MPSAKKGSSTILSQQVIQAAVYELEKSVLPADLASFEDVTLDDVQKTALDIESQLAARQSLRNLRRLSPLFSGLKFYSEAIKILCNGTLYLPWLWAPLSVILKISLECIEASEQIIKAYSCVGECLTRFEALKESFRRNPAFQQTFVVFYEDILKLHKEAYGLVRRPAWKQFFLSSSGRFQGRFDKILEDLKRHEDQLDRDANAYNIIEAKRMRDEERNNRQLQAISNWLRVNEADVPCIPSESSRHLDTWSWTSTQATMKSWFGIQNDNLFVWLQGNPGHGKSVIAGQIVKLLAAQGSLVISYFYAPSYNSAIRYDEVLKSLLFQMICNSAEMRAYVYGQCIGKSAASIEVLEKLLQRAATSLSDDLGCDKAMYVVVDGFDDMDVGKQSQFLRLMHRLSQDSLHRPYSAPCKILVTSRTVHHIKGYLCETNVVSLSEEKDKLTETIANYAEQRLMAHHDKFAELSLQESDLKDIACRISQKADGMFLWARLVLDYLTHNIFFTSQEIQQAVDTLPRELADFYKKVLTQMITRFDARSVDRLRTIFGWIAFAKRPLRRAELRSALLYYAGTTPMQSLAPSHLFDMCSPLVEELPDSSLRFIHESVREYLQTSESVVRITRDHAYLEHAIAATCCLSSSLDVFQPDSSPDDRAIRVIRGLHGFHVFAHEHWIDYVLHALSLKDREDDVSQLRTILFELSQKLAVSSDSATTEFERSPLSEPRLEQLERFPSLFRAANVFLLARNQKRIIYANSNNIMRRITELGDILHNYQITVRECLRIREFPGVTTEELAQFRRDYYRTAFICRFPSCYEGFEADEQRDDHEASHEVSYAKTLEHTVPPCQHLRSAIDQRRGSYKPAKPWFLSSPDRVFDTPRRLSSSSSLDLPQLRAQTNAPKENRASDYLAQNDLSTLHLTSPRRSEDPMASLKRSPLTDLTNTGEGMSCQRLPSRDLNNALTQLPKPHKALGSHKGSKRPPQDDDMQSTWAKREKKERLSI